MRTSMSLSFFPCSKPLITEKNILAVTKSLQNPKKDTVVDFEEALANYCGAKYAVAFSSGTAAKMAAYFAIDLDVSDQIITTPNAPISTICSGVALKNRIHLVDIDLKTGMMDLELIGEKLKSHASRGRPILVPFHFTGTLSDVQTIDQMLCHPEAIIIEDASQAFGSSYSDGSKVGCCACSEMTLFSFGLNKIMTTGQGGMVTTNDEKLFHRLKIFQNNGLDERKENPLLRTYEHSVVTGNHQLTNFQAAFGLSQFEEIEFFIQKRRLLIDRYHKNLQNIPCLTLFKKDFDKETSPHLFIIQIDFPALKTTREKPVRFLHEKGIETGRHYHPLHQQPVLKYNLDSSEEYPCMDLYYERTLTLPLYTSLNENEVDYICDTLKSALR